MPITEYPLVPAASPTGKVETVGVGGQVTDPFGDILHGVWTVPAWLHSFSVYIVGGGGNDAVDTNDGPVPGPTSPAVFYNVPCTPGDEWLLEGGFGIYHTLPALAGQRNTYNGGNGTAFFSDLGNAGGGASVLRRRNGSGTQMFALAAGYGGDWIVAGTRTAAAVESGVVTYGGLITEPGAGSDGEPSEIGDGAGGGGGWPGGDHGPTSGTAGIAGGMYLPAPNGTQLEGPTSPPFSYVYGDVRPTPWAPSGVGSVFIWYWPEDMPAGWHVGVGW